jgi:CBS domain containing-hemolysin-like protein
LLVDSSARAGNITAERAELLARALSVSEKAARQIMVPRNQVRYLDLDEPLERNIAEARAAGHTWMPVARGSLDQVEGVVNVKDLFFLLANDQLHSLGQVQRPVLFVPENVTLEQLLIEFRKRRRQLAVVVDEHGGTSGIVTLADVVAEVVGDVAELGRRVSEVKTLPGGRLELPGTTQLSDLEDRLDVRFDVDPRRSAPSPASSWRGWGGCPSRATTPTWMSSRSGWPRPTAPGVEGPDRAQAARGAACFPRCIGMTVHVRSRIVMHCLPGHSPER